MDSQGTLLCVDPWDSMYHLYRFAGVLFIGSEMADRPICSFIITWPKIDKFILFWKASMLMHDAVITVGQMSYLGCLINLNVLIKHTV